MTSLNSPADLRPIGTEFEQVFEPSGNSTDTRFAIWTYRVTAHVQYKTGHHKNAQSYWAESLEPVDVRYEKSRFVLDMRTGEGSYERVSPE